MLEALKPNFDLADGLGASKNPRSSIPKGVDAPPTAGGVELATASELAVASSGMMVTG